MYYDFPSDTPRARAGVNTNSVCLIIMSMLLLMVLWNAYVGSGSGGAYMHAMLSRFTSARLAGEASDPSANDTDDAAMSDEAKQVLDEYDKSDKATVVFNLTALKGETTDYKLLSEAQRATFERRVRGFLDKHDKVLVLFFAPWCGHCHNFMPKFVQVASMTSTPVALVNAECLPKACIRGADATLTKISYFPLVVVCSKKDGVLVCDEVPSQDLDVIAAAANDEAADPASAESTADAEESLDAFW